MIIKTYINYLGIYGLMVLEDMINAERAERNPWKVFFLGFLYSSIALFFSLWVFREYSSLVVVFLTVFASVPLVRRVIVIEEKKDLEMVEESALLREHMKALEVFIFLFLGFVVSFSFWYTLLPSDYIGSLFDMQIETIKQINARIITGAFSGGNLILQILSNNLRVLLFCILFSFFYGMGAIFILTWNASVIAAAVGTFFRNNISIYAEHLGFLKIAGYFHIFSLSLLRYLTHGIFEILAYFVGGLAGGIVSVAVLRNVSGKQFRYVMFDFLSMFFLAVFLLVIAALIEVYGTTALF